MPQALWYESAGRAALRPAMVAAPREGEALVRGLYSGISRGTERLVLQGRIPASEYERMRCPHQDGAFPFPVKYGYALAGEIVEGPAGRIGEQVFVLHPHQDRLCVPLSDLHTLPNGLTPRRAALAANMETALNVIWDAGVGPGDHVLVVGGGVLGLLIAAIAARIAGVRATIVDVNGARASVAEKLGMIFTTPDGAPTDQDVVIHTSATEEGLRLALHCAGTEAKVVEASWHGDKPVSMPLGEGFHSRRLQIISSQVGAVPPGRRARWDFRRRMAAALDLLRDDTFDALITGEVTFTDAPQRLPEVLADGSPGLMTVLRYP